MIIPYTLKEKKKNVKVAFFKKIWSNRSTDCGKEKFDIS
jgi:hypothetical protein